MTCPCGAPAESWTIPHPLSAQPFTITRCSAPTCRREYVETQQGPRWIKSGVWCCDPECDAPTFRMVTHPRHGHLVALWPTGAAIVAEYLAGESDADGNYSKTMQYYCSLDCAPDLGDPPHHTMEQGGQPHPDAIGPCVGLLRAKDRHADCFTPQRGTFYRAWLHDELHLDQADYERLIALWESDRAS